MARVSVQGLQEGNNTIKAPARLQNSNKFLSTPKWIIYMLKDVKRQDRAEAVVFDRQVWLTALKSVDG